KSKEFLTMQNQTFRHSTLFLVVAVLFLLVSCGTPATPAAPPTAAGNATSAVTPAVTSASTLAAVSPATAAPTTAATTASTMPATGAATKNTLILADISDSPSKRIAAFQPLADYLGAHLGKFGINTGSVKIAPDFPTMIQWMKSEQVDIYFDSPYPTF